MFATTRPRPTANVPALVFRGQQPDERVLLRTRPYPLWLVVALWPVLVGVALLLGCVIATALMPQFAGAWAMADLIIGALTVVFLIRWAIMDAYRWWFTLSIVTDRRVIFTNGGVKVTTVEIPLAKLQEVRVKARTILQWICRIGDVTVTSAGDNQGVELLGMHHPMEIVRLIYTARDTHLTPTPGPVVTDPTLRRVLDDLAKPDPLPTPQALDPRVCVRWPLRRAVNVPLLAGETVLGIISRHWWALLEREVWAIVILIGTLLLNLIGVYTGFPIGAVVIAGVIVSVGWATLGYLNFADDIFLLTTRRVIDVDRRFFIFFEAQTAIEYGRIQEIKFDIPSVAGRLLKFGDVTVIAAGQSAPIRMTTIPYPKLIEAAIERNRQAFKRRDEIAAANLRKDDMKQWFAEVVTELVTAAPDLRLKTVEAALTEAQQLGLRVLVAGEMPVTGLRPGLVVMQHPEAGARCLRGSDISVTLSRM